MTVRRVLRAVTAGEPVDWEYARRSAATAVPALSFIDALRDIEQIAAASRTLAAEGLPLASSLGSAAAAPDAVPDRWGTMRLDAVLGFGAHGIVYRAFDEHLHREVAVKLLRAASRPSQVERFLHEARLLARIRHPNVVTIHGAEVIDGQPGIWMERLEGSTLDAHVRRHGPLSALAAAQIGVEICRGLAAIHHAGVLHRDLKAQNVMREDGGRLVLMDFSSSRAADEPGRLAGTPLYLAPEVLDGSPATVKSDLYALGVLLHYLVAGEFPVTGADLGALRRAHQQRPAPPLRHLRPTVPSAFVKVVQRALSPEPASRQDSAADLESELLCAQGGPDTRGRWVAVTAAAVLGLLTIGASTALWTRAPAVSTSLPATGESQPWVLIGAFDNATGEKELGHAIEYALERELTNSRQIRVAPRARVDDTLRLMKRPADTVLDRPTAREIGLRDAELRTFVVGRVEDRQSGIHLGASLVDASTGATIASVTAEAPGRDHVQTAVRQLSDEIRSALGDATVARPRDTGLERVSTPSIDALRVYSESYREGARQEWPAALELAKLAVELDPTFPAARIWLAWCLRRANAPSSAFRPVAADALQLATHATDWERMWIIGSYHSLFDQDEQAIPAYQAVLRLQPDHYWASGNIAIALARMGRYGDAVPVATHLADLRPNDHRTLNIAFGTLRRAGRYDEAERMAERMQALHINEQRYWLPEAWLFKAYVAWLSADATKTLDELEHVVSRADALGDVARSSILPEAALMYLALGRPSDTRRVLALVPDVTLRNLFLAVAAVHLGERARARELMRTPEVVTAGTRELWDRLWVHTRTGQLDDARRLTERLRQPTAAGPLMVESTARRDEWLTVAEADIAVAAGSSAAAIALLERALPALMIDVTVTPSQMYRGAEALADALIAQGRVRDAALTLQRVLDRHERAAFPGAPFWSMRSLVKLAALAERHDVVAPDVRDRLRQDVASRLSGAESDHAASVR